ncbi:hypothetical protein [Guggenheimella bovis]
MKETLIQFTLLDLLLAILIIAAIVLIITAIRILLQVLKVMKENRPQIDGILSSAPGIAQNVEKITGLVSKGVDGAYKGAMGVVEKFKK